MSEEVWGKAEVETSLCIIALYRVWEYIMKWCEHMHFILQSAWNENGKDIFSKPMFVLVLQLPERKVL